MTAPLARYRVLATDYDGTIAEDGRVDAATLAALEAAREAGIRLVLVTGRELADLSNTFDRVELFERVVAENGALLFNPATRATRSLAPPPPPALLSPLAAANVPLSIGHTIIATVEPHHHAVLDAIRDAGVEWHVIFNKGSVMALPAGVSKASGLRCALEELDLPAEATVAIGDGENDHALLASCGLAVAVANAVPALKEIAQIVTTRERGAGVRDVIRRWLDGELV
jgi:hydroxymethylpyrimidine pyrophosphatase-like HAD family hydrolase